MDGIEELLASSLTMVAAKIKAKEVSPVELTRATLDRIATLNRVTNAFITVLEGPAMRAAETAQSEIMGGNYKGPLHGIPYSVKDCIATKGVRTTAGSALLSEYVPDYDGTVVVKATLNGGVLLGKNNLHEFAGGPTNDNPHYGRVGNPWDMNRIPGGSSGGSASAVALGMGYFSLGSDGGGSVRIPAGLCGVVGLKTSNNLVSRYGMVPPISKGQDHRPGILTRTVEDTAVVLQAVAGQDPNDPESYRGELPNYVDGLQKDVKGLRIGLPSNYFFELCDPEVESAVRSAARRFAEMGAILEDVTIPYVEEAMLRLGAPLSDFHRTALRTRRDLYGEDILLRRLADEFVLARDLAKMQRVIEIFKAGMAKIMKTYDALLTPTTPVPAYEFDAEEVVVGTNKTYKIREPLAPSILMLRFTSTANTTGLPAISVPCGRTTAGLPIGLQIIGRPQGDGTILALAHQYSLASGHAVERPPEPRS